MLATWLGFYVAGTPGLDFGDNSSLRVDEDNMPQPDLLLRLPEAAGGRSRIAADGYVCGAPERIVEIAASSVSYDLHQKLDVYRRSGVQEYVVHRTEDAAIDWFVSREGRYVAQVPDGEGLLRSAVFPGLWLDDAAALRGDLQRLRTVVDRGGATPAHVAFAAGIAASR